MSVLQKPAQWAGQLVNDYKKTVDQREQMFEKAGMKIDADKTLAARMESQWKLEMELLDDRYDIEDKVKLQDLEIEMVGKTWGARNPEFRIRYVHWRKLIGWWPYNCSRRSPFFTREIRIHRKMELILPDGRRTDVMVPMTVKLATAYAMKENLQEGDLRVMEEVDGPVSMKPSEQDYNVEKNIRLSGEGTMLMCGKTLMLWSWLMEDVTAKSVFVFHSPPTISQAPTRQTEPGLAADFYERTPKDKTT